jgi:membrane associated rhomboid family serine protease
LCPADAGSNTSSFKAPAILRRAAEGGTLVTKVLILVNVVLYGLQILSGGLLTAYLYYVPIATLAEPWRMITSGFIHSDNLLTDPSSALHIVLNMYTLWILGGVLEPMLGRLRFLGLYMLAILGGSAAVLLFSNPFGGVLGASGGIFGLMGAYFVVLRSLGGNSNSIVGIIAINLAFTFLNPGVSWQAHIGGLVIGGAVAFIYSKTRRAEQQSLQVGLLIGVAALLILTSISFASNLLS